MPGSVAAPLVESEGLAGIVVVSAVLHDQCLYGALSYEGDQGEGGEGCYPVERTIEPLLEAGSRLRPFLGTPRRGEERRCPAAASQPVRQPVVHRGDC